MVTEAKRSVSPMSRGLPQGVVKHSLWIAGHPTRISHEHAFWSALRRLAAERDQSVAALVAMIDAGRGDANLSSAICVYLLETYMALPRVGLS